MKAEDLVDILKGMEKEKREKRKKHEELERKGQAEAEVREEEKRKKYPEILKKSEELFAWLEEFKQTEIYKTMERNGWSCIYDRINNKYGFYIDEERGFSEIHFSGFGNRRNELPTPESLATHCDWIVEKLYDLIKSGEIYDEIVQATRNSL